MSTNKNTKKYIVCTNCVRVTDVEKFKQLIKICATADGSTPEIITTKNATGEVCYGFKTHAYFSGLYLDGFRGVPIDATKPDFNAADYETSFEGFISEVRPLIAPNDALVITRIIERDDSLDVTATVVTQKHVEYGVSFGNTVREVARKLLDDAQWVESDSTGSTCCKVVMN